MWKSASSGFWARIISLMTLNLMIVISVAVHQGSSNAKKQLIFPNLTFYWVMFDLLRRGMGERGEARGGGMGTG